MPPRGRVPGAELRDCVPLQGGDDAGDEEGQPHRCAGHRTGFTEEGENTGPDHRTDTQESRTAYGHGTLTLLHVGWVAGIRSAAHSHASRFACRPMRLVQTMLSQISHCSIFNAVWRHRASGLTRPGLTHSRCCQQALNIRQDSASRFGQRPL
jgi:hypothetical protein